MFSTFKAPYTGLKITLISKWGIIPFGAKITVYMHFSTSAMIRTDKGDDFKYPLLEAANANICI